MSATAVTTTPSPRPGADEFAPYYGKYISLVPDEDIVATLEKPFRQMRAYEARSACY